MASNIARTPTPEDQELAAKKAELAAMETQLAERELDFATARLEWHAFEQRYLRTVGVKFTEIDHLEAQIADALNRRNPSDAARQRAVDARSRATASAGVTETLEQRTPGVEVKPPEEIRSLYREIAKRIHPDLATDVDERTRRTLVMAEANRAYSSGSETRLRAILTEWETSPEAVTGEGIGADLVRTIRKIHQAARRLAAIDTSIGELNDSELVLLKARTESARNTGRDLLAEMAGQLDEQLLLLRQQRDGLRSHEASS